MIDILIPVFLVIFILLLMHTYLGIEIIKRQIIFTDLAVGQMAAVGTAFSLVFFHGEFRYLFSILFAVITALIIAFVNNKNKYIEAFIGIFYAFGFSMLFLVMSKNPSGMEHIKELTASDVLYVDFKDVFISAVLYSTFFAILYFSKKLNYYEFIYFPIFALTIVHSVSLVGVLVVFTFLVIPAFLGLLISEKNSFFVGILYGSILSLFAVILAVSLDFPVGYTITAVLSCCGILLALLK
ncbi:MAG TPA: metal ABC transporter permease [Persephonella sp.]|nr:metal ABC transporter permease [Hydrogenothermaceae bacterium]HIQ25569.1 metal ABC transporter permease [Persephonella sp.]